MCDTHSQIDTRRYKTNKSQIDSNYRGKQLYSNTDTSSMNNYHSEMNNNQIARISVCKDNYATTEVLTKKLRPSSMEGINHPKFGTGHETNKASKTWINETASEQKPGQRNLCTETTGRRREDGNQTN